MHYITFLSGELIDRHTQSEEIFLLDNLIVYGYCFPKQFCDTLENAVTRKNSLEGKDMKKPLLCAVLLSLSLTVASGQTDLSTIRGAANDPSGAAVPNAKITLTAVETNVSREAVTTSDGVYEIPYLTPGTYRLTAVGAGSRHLSLRTF